MARDHNTNGTFPVPAAAVVAAVAAAYHLPADNFRLWARGRRMSEARQVVCALLHDDAWLTWAEIARLMGVTAGSGGDIAAGARRANPDAVTAIRARLHPNGDQGALW